MERRQLREATITARLGRRARKLIEVAAQEPPTKGLLQRRQFTGSEHPRHDVADSFCLGICLACLAGYLWFVHDVLSHVVDGPRRLAGRFGLFLVADGGLLTFTVNE